MWHVRVLTILGLFIQLSANAQLRLVINEVSQGASGNKEYVEFVVTGPPTCTTPLPCLDLRGKIIDDNNGDFASGSGTGIAQGASRFSNAAIWSCVPQGTIILVYNDADINPLIPANDLSLSDGNNRLVIPVSSNLLEGTSVSPTSGDDSYPTAAASWTAGATLWASQLSMNNSNDSFQVRDNAGAASAAHAVSWGNNTTATFIYFAGAAGGKVFSMTNNTGNNPDQQANWTSGNAGTDETPGAGNNAANTAWISAMQNSTSGMQVTTQVVNTGCTGATGQVTATVSGGSAPFDYSWSNGATTNNSNTTSNTISGLAAGPYTIEVTDNNGCVQSASATVQSSGTLQLSVSSTNESCSGTCDGTATATVSGGTAPYLIGWSNLQPTPTISGLCPATYTVGVSDQNGCTATASVTIAAGANTADATIQAAGPFTTSDSPMQLQVNTPGGTWLTADCGSCLGTTGIFSPQAAGAGTFQICYTVGTGSCAANDCINLIVTEGCTPQTTEQTILFCAEDSVFVFGNWEHLPDTYSQTYTGVNGCDSTHNIVLAVFPTSDSQETAGICPGDSVLVFGNWVSEPGVYSQEEQTIAGCSFTHYYTVYLNDCEKVPFNLFIPNTFTPNGDHTNDVFKIELAGGMVDEGYIVNRWGNEVARFDAEHVTWNGKAQNGEDVQEGVYTYIVYYTRVSGGGREKAHGFVTVIR